MHVCIVIVAAHCTIKSGRDCRRAEASGPAVEEEVQGHCCDIVVCLCVCVCACVYVCNFTVAAHCTIKSGRDCRHAGVFGQSCGGGSEGKKLLCVSLCACM